jgi:hypothetical protein
LPPSASAGPEGSPGPPSAVESPGSALEIPGRLSGSTEPPTSPKVTATAQPARPIVKTEIVKRPVPVSPVPVPLPNEAVQSRPSGPLITAGVLGAGVANAIDAAGAASRGAVVQSVSASGPAERGGLLPGDLIVEYGGTSVSDAAHLNSLSTASTPGDTVLVRVLRGNAGRTVEVVVGERPIAAGGSGTVYIHYAADADQRSAENLAAYLREVINDPGYLVRTIRTTRRLGNEGEVLYNSAMYSTLADTLVRNSSSWWSRQGSRRVAFASKVEPRVGSKAVILIMPGEVAVPSDLASPTVTIVYPNGGDPAMANRLAAYLRTQTPQKYLVRTSRAKIGPEREGQIEYDNARMGDVAQVLARDAASWISREYGRRVVLQPTASGRIGSNAVVLWLPGR